MRKIIFLPLFLSMILLSNQAIAASSQYDISGFTGSFDLTETGLTTNYSGNCDVQMASTNTFITNTGTFDSTITWRSPDTNVIGFSTLPGLSNTSCLSYGRTSFNDAGRDSTSTFYESSYSVSHTADSGFITTETRYLCDVPTETINFEIGRGLDSRGDCQYRRRAATGLNINTWISELNNNYNRCGDLSGWIDVSCNSSFASGGANDVTIQFIYPFNSSSTGTVGYNFSTSTFSAGSTVTPSIYVDIIDAVDQTNTTIHSELGILQAARTFVAFSGVSSLASDRTHLFVITYQILDNGIAFASTINPPIINLSIFTFRPDYLCGDFGSCINGTQSQVCVDQFGVAPDEIRTRSCFDVPTDTVNLGFEAVKDLLPEFIYTCQKDWTLITCIDVLATIPARFPVNWTISADLDRPGGGYRQNYIRISDDTATVGTKSLKMNYIPPKLSEPISDPGNASLTICGNKTVGDFPFVTTGLNQSLYVSRNISFPSPFIQIRLDSRKCSEQILQYDYTSGIYSLCDIVGVQRKLCYATNCSEEPDGNYRVGVFDAQTLDQIVEFSDVAINSWTSHIIDLSNAGLLVNHNYTIIIVVNPLTESGVYDPNSHCVYFDNFRVTITETALPECTTRCEGFNLLLANQNGDICFFTEITNSPACAPDQSTAESFQDFDTVCIGTTLHFFNNETGLWDQTLNSDICIEQINETQQQIEDTQPLSDITSYISFFEFIFSPIFIYMIFAMIISGVLSAGIARITKNGDGVFQVFGVTMIIFLLLGSLPGIAVIPIWISIAVIAIISLLIAQKLRGFGFPGGGG